LLVLVDFVGDHVLLYLLSGLIQANFECLSVGALKIVQPISLFHQNRLDLNELDAFIFLILENQNGLIQLKLLLLAQFINVSDENNNSLLVVLEAFDNFVDFLKRH
jgi:hypothetical protein